MQDEEITPKLTPTTKKSKKMFIVQTGENDIRRGLNAGNQRYDQEHVIIFCSTLLRTHGLTPHNVLNDGTCMPRALLHACGLDQDQHLLLRKLMVFQVFKNWIEKPRHTAAMHRATHPPYEFAQDDDAFATAERYYNYTTQGHVYLTDLELSEFANFFKMNVIVHYTKIVHGNILTGQTPVQYNRTEEEIQQGYEPPTIHILHVNDNHYLALHKNGEPQTLPGHASFGTLERWVPFAQDINAHLWVNERLPLPAQIPVDEEPAQPEDDNTKHPLRQRLRFISRLQRERIRVLVQKMENKKFSINNLKFFEHAYTNISLGKIMLALNNGNTGVTQRQSERLVHILEKVISIRLAKEGCKDTPLLIARSYMGFMDIIKPQKALKQGAACLPDDYPKQANMSYKYIKPIGAYLLNNKPIAQLTREEINNICTRPCACSSFPNRYIDKDHGHVITNMPDILERYSANLAKLAHEGSKFRPGLKYGKFTTDDREELIDTLSKACDAYIRARIDEGLVQAWPTWKGIVMEAIIAEIDDKLPVGVIAKPPNGISMMETTSLADNDLRRLRQVHKDMNVTLTDKMSTAFLFLCKKLAIMEIMKDLNSNKFFQKIDKTISALLDEQRTKILELGLQPGEPRFPYYYVMGKLHKEPVGFRFIAAANDVISTEPQQHLAVLLKILDYGSTDLLNEARNKIPGITCTLPINLNNTTDAIKGIEFYNRNKTHEGTDALQTADVARLYTNLPLEEVYRILTKHCKRLWKENHYLTITPGCKTGKWNTKKLHNGGKGRYATYTYDYDEFLALLKYCLFNTYVTFGEDVYKQFQGIAMGANSAPLIANLFLGAYELDFFEQLAQAVEDDPPTKVEGKILFLTEFPTTTNFPPPRGLGTSNGIRRTWTRGDLAIYIAKCFEHHKRYLDDILSINNPIFDLLVKEDQTLHGFHGIYPKELEIEATKPSTRVPFLDVMIQRNRHPPHKLETLYYSKFDGKDYAKLHRPLYPARHSNIAINQKLGVIKGRLTSFSRHISPRYDFVKQTGNLAMIFHNKQYNAQKILSVIEQWIHSKRGLIYATSPKHMMTLMLHEISSRLAKRQRT